MSFSRLNWISNVLRRINYRNITKNLYAVKQCNRTSSSSTVTPATYLLGASILSWNPFKKNDELESPEDKLIMTIKRSILMIQRAEYNKAEQMLHLALRMAQDINSKDGVTYIYDIMANLAMEMSDFKKAEKLFVDVMRRLVNEGAEQDDNKMLHISSKIAHMAHLQENFEKAGQGFQWTLGKIEDKLKTLHDDEDLKELLGLTKNWYAQYLMDSNMLEDAKKYLTEAYEIYTTIHGQINHEAVMMLNNLGVVCIKLNDNKAAENYLNNAIEFSKEIPDMIESNVFKANLGIVYLKKGLIAQGKEMCATAWRLSKKNEYQDGMEQANYCLDQIEQLTKS